MTRPPPLRTDGSNPFARFSMETRVPRIARDLLDRNPTLAPASRDAVERLAREHRRERSLPAPAPAGAGPRGLDGGSRGARDRALAGRRVVLRRARLLPGARDRLPLLGDGPRSVRPRQGGGARRRTPLVASGAGPRAETGSRDERIHGAARRVPLGQPRRPQLHGRRGARARERRSPRRRARRRRCRSSSGPEPTCTSSPTTPARSWPSTSASSTRSSKTLGARVTVHLKMQPVFVSDALPRDVWGSLDRMDARGGGACGQRGDAPPRGLRRGAACGSRPISSGPVHASSGRRLPTSPRTLSAGDRSSSSRATPTTAASSATRSGRPTRPSSRPPGTRRARSSACAR